MTHDVYKPGKNSLKVANASICGAHKTWKKGHISMEELIEIKTHIVDSTKSSLPKRARTTNEQTVMMPHTETNTFY